MDSQRIDVADGVTLTVGTRLDTRHPTIVLLHGNGSNHRQFDVHEASLGSEFQRVAPSLRGHGGSTLPRELETVIRQTTRRGIDPSSPRAPGPENTHHTVTGPEPHAPEEPPLQR